MSRNEKEEGFLYIYIYIFVGYTRTVLSQLTGILSCNWTTAYNSLIYELSSKENLLDSNSSFNSLQSSNQDKIDCTFSKINSNNFFLSFNMSFDKKKENWQNQTSSRQRSIEGDNFHGIILAKSPKIPIGNWTSPPQIEQDEEEEREMPKILFLRSSFRRETVSRSSRVQLSPSKGSPDAWQSNFTSELQRDPMSFRGLFPSTLPLPLSDCLSLRLFALEDSRGSH